MTKQGVRDLNTKPVNGHRFTKAERCPHMAHDTVQVGTRHDEWSVFAYPIYGDRCRQCGRIDPHSVG